MEPKLPSPEAAPAQPSQPSEYQPSPEQSVERPEYSPERAAERAGEQYHPASPIVSAAPSPVTLPMPIPIQTAQDDDATVADDGMPLSAADEDLIEKEWVDKAKKIVTETKDDPHMREREVGKLQADYLRKRYGKELGESA